MALTKKDLLAIGQLIRENNLVLEAKIEKLIDVKFKLFYEEHIVPIKTRLDGIDNKLKAIDHKIEFIQTGLEGLRVEVDHIKKHLKLDGPIKPTMRVH